MVELLHDAAQELGNQQKPRQQHDQQQHDLVAERQLPHQDQDQESDEGPGTPSGMPPGTPPRMPHGSPPGSPPVPERVESEDEDITGTKIGIPKFTGQETDISDKARD